MAAIPMSRGIVPLTNASRDSDTLRGRSEGRHAWKSTSETVATQKLSSVVGYRVPSLPSDPHQSRVSTSSTTSSQLGPDE